MTNDRGGTPEVMFSKYTKARKEEMLHPMVYDTQNPKPSTRPTMT